VVLIVRESKDESAKKVLQWCKTIDVKVIDICHEEAVDIISFIELSDSSLKILISVKSEIHDLSKIKVAWFRRGHFTFKLPHLPLKDIKNNHVLETINQHLSLELKTLSDFVYFYLKENTRLINEPNFYNFNKLIALKNAVKVGLSIPKTIITRDKKDVINFIKQSKSIITKNIQDVLSIVDKDNAVSFVQATKICNIDIMPEIFFYSKFQNNIDKKYEIRSFVFGEKIFSIAIYTQANESSKIDGRHIDKFNLVRIVPYFLPSEVEEKILQFMKLCDLFTGSIDMIYTGNDYIFLEVNPVGQFDYVSGYGNFQIENHIALYFKNLCKND
jgi:hypothetical protein